MLSLIVYALVSIGIFSLLLVWARCLAIDAKVASELLDNAYEASQRLIKSEATPDSVLQFTEFFAAQMGRPALVRGFAWHLIKGNRRGAVSARTLRLSADLESLDPNGMENFSKMIAFGMVSSAAADPLFSRIYLNVVKMFLSQSGSKNDTAISPDRARTVAVDVAETRFGDCMPVAA